ncbi:MAG TPA: M23 family metallopeptidase, partial [Caldithrix abyssi]|nr:M23 family metallopeptidase [Caldithrix abyssi]
MNRFFLLLLFLPIVAFSQRYLWPTNASPYMTSSFCEYRPGHYHSAIDIKTWNREGYPIYAVDEGRIYQIRVSPFGYGKALYLKLKDGRLAVYGHLQKFTPEIERVIRKLQIKNRRYTVTWRPESWPVKRGQVLGYTGQTGIGVPHLHFEIRSDERHPLNPLRFYPQVKDRLPPRLQSLLVIPQNASSRVDGSFLPRVYALQKNRSGEYVLKQPIKASGIIGFALRGYDQANGVYNKFSFYSLELIVNRTPLFRMRYDTLDFSLTAQVDVEIYYPFKADSNRVFHKLYIEPFNRLPFYQRKLGLGLISVNRDTLPFKIIASDFFGNRSVVKGKIIPAPSLPFGLPLTARQPDVAFLGLTLPRPLSLLRFYYETGKRKWRAAETFEILRRTYLSDRQQMLVRLPLPTSFNSCVKVRFAQAHFATDERIIPLDNSRKDLTETGLHFLNDRLVFTFRPPFVLPEMRLVLQTDEAETPLPL